MLKTALKERGLEIVIGVLITAVGLALSADDGVVGSAGAVLSAVGGIQIAWVAATYVAEARTLRDQQQRVGVQARHLGVEIAQIRETIWQAQHGELDSDVALALIQQAQNSLSGVLNELQSLHGDPLDTEALVETAEQIRDLGAKMTKVASEDGGAGTGDVIESLQLKMKTLVNRLEHEATATRREERTSCPECGAEVLFKLGTERGSSARPLCPDCGYSFHAHRRADRDVLVRRPGAADEVPSNQASPSDEDPAAPSDPQRPPPRIAEDDD